MHHPYHSFPARQFWSKSVTNNFDPGSVGEFTEPLIQQHDVVVSAGSCFAANLIPFLQNANFNYMKTEYVNPIYSRVAPEALSYAKFSAGYGNIYTARQLYQLLLRSLGEFKPAEDCWITGDHYVDPFRPGLTYAARCRRELEALTAAHLRSVKRAFINSTIFILTLGLTEAWMSSIDGAVFPGCPGTIAGNFDPQRHIFVNFTVNDVTNDLAMFIRRLRGINPCVRIIITVSPVPLVATADSRHVLAATIYSKSVLRVAAEMTCREFTNTYYFPAYEIVTGPQAPDSFFDSDRRNVSKEAVETVMGAFLRACDVTAGNEAATLPEPKTPSREEFLSAIVAEIECEEAALDT